MTKPLVYIVIYSLYHHVYKLSLSIKEGLESKGVDVQLFQVQETLSDEILSKMQAPSKPDLPIISVDRLSEPDGILFGLPTRFGTMPAQMKALLDASGALWAKGALAGKFAGTFFSTASQHGGQETTALTAVTYFAHHGMMYVPFGYANAAMGSVDEVIGGSAYGCGTISDGDGSRQPSHTELAIAENQGANFAEILTVFVKGRDIMTRDQPYDGSTHQSNSTTDPQLSSAVDTTNHQPMSDTSHVDSHTGAGVAAGTTAAAAAAATAAASSAGKRSSTTGDNTFIDKTDNIENVSVGERGTSLNTTKTVTSKNDIAPSSSVETPLTDGFHSDQPHSKTTGSTPPTSADAVRTATASDTIATGTTPANTTGTTPANTTGTTPANTTGTTPSGNVADTNVTGTNATDNATNPMSTTTATDASKVGDTMATGGATNAAVTGATGAGATGATGATPGTAATTGATGATPGTATTTGATGATPGTATTTGATTTGATGTAGATGATAAAATGAAGATGAAAGAAKTGTTAATNAATTAAGKSTATNPVKESIVKDKVKEKPKKKKWFCC
ncbi:hypothetical protein INT47_010649 [Mucor saturninus]|uniref:Flavodoxin-like domain-containing protein n=1 Tax=Mucor saturninus TaxID=64648 RepID=A0A8H7QMA0_9FUNG|nr:hypothetical protein INT47_010649 [Mucor saturninus]